MSLRKKLTDQKKRWAPYPAQLRTGQNAHICWKTKYFEILKKMSMSLRKKLMDQKNMGTLSCSVKNRTACPYLLRNEMFWNFEKNVNEFTRKVDGPKKKRWAPYPAQLRTGQNAHICWKKKIIPFLSPLNFLLIDSAAKFEFSSSLSINFAGFFRFRTGLFSPMMLSLPETFQ